MVIFAFLSLMYSERKIEKEREQQTDKIQKRESFSREISCRVCNRERREKKGRGIEMPTLTHSMQGNSS